MQLRPVTKGDAGLLWLWVNEDAVRKESLSDGPSDFESHEVWLDGRLSEWNSCRMFIGEESSRPFGIVRFEDRDDWWIVSISVDAALRGRGFGGAILRMGMERVRGRFLAYVNSGNVVSRRMFESSGYVETSRGDGVITYTWER